MSSSPVAKLCMSCAHFTQDICYRFQKYSFVTGLAEYVSAELSRGSKTEIQSDYPLISD